MAIKSLFPAAQLQGGGLLEQGFFYTFFLPARLNQEFLPLLEEKMRFFFKADYPIDALEMMRDNAHTLLLHRGQKELAARVEITKAQLVTLFSCNGFYDLTKAPFLSSTGEVAACKLLSIKEIAENTYRVEGVAASDPKTVKDQVKLLKEIDRQDHRKIGSAKGLFSLEEEGLFWHPAGVRLREQLHTWWLESRIKAGFQEIKTPAHPERTSFLPNHAKLFLKGAYKERELPVRFCEWGEQHFLKDEEIEWRGLLGVTPVTADLATSFCLPSQLNAELTSSLQFLENGVKLLGFRVRFLLTLDDKYLTRPSPLEKEVSTVLRDALRASGCEYAEESVPKLCSFGPQVTVIFQDSFGRDWPLGTLGVATTLLSRLQSTNDKKPLPPVVWSQLFVSLERFIGVFLEQSGGALPPGLRS